MATKKSPAVKSSTRKTSAKGKTRIIMIPQARGKYRIVDDDAHIIEPSSAESRSEDEILTPSKRARLEDITRNLVRNSSLFNTMLGSLTTNVVATCGGKVVLSIPNEETNRAVKHSFKDYTRNVDFYLGDSLNKMLKRVLREYVIGGECVFIFDDGLFEDSGKIAFFESSELVEVNQAEVEKRYGKGSWCSQGKVYSRNGRHIGTIVSKSQKGFQGDADPKACYFLKKDPNGNPIDNYWFQLSSNWREGRGTSQACSAISTIHQVEDLVTSEILASRRNAQIFCWLTQSPEETKLNIPSSFSDDVDFNSMTDEQIADFMNSQLNGDAQTKNLTFKRAKEASITYEQLPEGLNAQQLATTHPNTNVQTLVDWLANRASSTLGLSKIFATGNPTDVDWRANQLYSWPAIEEFQKTLEQFCDWVFNCWLKWSMRNNKIKAYVAEDYMDYVDWSWRGIDSIDPVARENAIELQLKNMTASMKDILGADWKDKLTQIAEERKWMLANGLVPTSDLLKSGGQTEQSKETVKEVSTNE